MKEFELFSRNKGPLCLVGKVLLQHAYETSTENLVKELLSCGLKWYWSSEREELPLAGESDLPAVRPLTALTDHNLCDLVSDLEEIDENQEHRWLELVGLRTELGPPLRKRLEAATLQLLAEDNGPIEIVVCREGDSSTEYIFVQRHTSEEIASLWKMWGVDLAQARARPYKTLDWMLLHLNAAVFPIFLRSKSDRRLKRYESIDQLRKQLRLADVQDSNYQGWDKHGFRVVLSLSQPMLLNSLEVDRSEDLPEMKEALKEFAEAAAAQGTVFTPPEQFHDLRQIYDAYNQASDKR